MGHEPAQQGIFDCTPILFANSVSASIAYYRDVLGFKVGWRWSDETRGFLEAGAEGEVGFALVCRDAVRLMLSERSQGQPGMWLHLDLSRSQEIDALHDEWSKNGAHIVEPPANRPWGNYEMRVADLDGHVLRIASPGKSPA
jgi:uncharacterized glyoxalase superfamily protein PhnB